MNWFDELGQEDATALIALLSEACGVMPPRISFTGRKLWRGVYFPSKQLIRVHRRSQLWVLAHEFAHHLNHDHDGLGVVANDREPHSERFYYKLKRVIRTLDIAEYPWRREYKQLARWAKRDALTSFSAE